MAMRYRWDHNHQRIGAQGRSMVLGYVHASTVGKSYKPG